MWNSECGLELSVVSCQLSVECLAATRRGARSNCGMRNSDCGMDNQGRESAAAEPGTTHGLPTRGGSPSMDPNGVDKVPGVPARP